MSNLTVDGTSTWASGTPDTRTILSDGPTGDLGVAAQINGLSDFAIALQTVLGVASSLKGSATDLSARLNVLLSANGSLQSGDTFPTLPPPVDGQLYFRNDTKIIYVYDAATGQWVYAFVNALYALLDGTQQFTGPLTIKSVVPGIRLIGQEANARDWTIRENGGSLQTLLNTGTESAPVMSEDNFFCPTGIYMPYGGINEPNGWKFCDGQALSRTAFARLYNVIGTAYGSGDGSTTYNVPDLRGRVPIMIDVATGRITSASVNGANAASIGGAGGLQTHTLTLTEAPSHDHVGSVGAGSGSNTGDYNQTWYVNAAGFNTVTANAGKTKPNGGGQAHSNTQPWLAGNYIIKT